MPRTPPDQTELMIIRLLQEDGRMTTAELARRTRVSEPTVRKKLARLQEEKIIRITAIADPIDLGYDAPAYIGLDVERSKIREVAAAIARYPTVSSVAVATGPYDIIIEAAFRSIPELYDFVLRDLAKHKAIKDSHSFIVLQRFKQDEHRGVVGISEEKLQALSLPKDPS